MGGGTKLIRTLRAGDGGPVCSGVGEEVGMAEDVGLGDSCANPAGLNATTIKKIAGLTFLVMSSGVETSLTIGKAKQENIEGFFDFARNDKG
jgi:hypothetical protein